MNRLAPLKHCDELGDAPSARHRPLCRADPVEDRIAIRPFEGGEERRSFRKDIKRSRIALAD